VTAFLEKTEPGSLPVDVVSRVVRLFGRLNWEIYVKEDDDEEDVEQLFDRYCKFLSRLSKEEQELVLKLTQEFLYCPSTTYNPMIKKALLQIDKSKVERCKQIFLLPLVTPRHSGQVKSSTAWLYQCTTEVISKIPDLKSKPRQSYLDPNLLKRHPDREDALILLCDDFVGTGETAEEAINYYNNNLRKDDDIPVLVALVAQQVGLDLIKSLSFDVAVTYTRNRGISDSQTLDPVSALELMTRIENKLKIDPYYIHGYKRSEALVSMMRTPDNTFPVFWCGEGCDGNPWPAPFPRD
jgi:hypothetical protein